MLHHRHEAGAWFRYRRISTAPAPETARRPAQASSAGDQEQPEHVAQPLLAIHQPQQQAEIQALIDQAAIGEAQQRRQSRDGPGQSDSRPASQSPARGPSPSAAHPPAGRQRRGTDRTGRRSRWRPPRVSAKYSAIRPPRREARKRAAAPSALTPAPGPESRRRGGEAEMDMGRPGGIQQRQRAKGAPFWHKIARETRVSPRSWPGHCKAFTRRSALNRLCRISCCFSRPFCFFGPRLIGGMAASCAARPTSISFSTVLVSADRRISTKGNLR